ncbi:MAG: CpsD/CapB family tyrosine-protein kinase [Acidobacteriia bacterium]|nr:CpsD/CapB family tyrosine-protein kinase [Terriglobia bacterium]
MSRIHDALKRAEQERATSTGTHVEPAFDQPELRNEVRSEGQRENMPSFQPSPATVMTTMASGLNYESLLARCPQTEWSPDPRTMLFFQDDDNRVGAEEFRTLRSRLYQIREKMPLKRLLVTSALPKEGKSFVAANLAQVLVRQHGRRALVIDGDLRNPGMHRHLGAAQTPGLSEYLLGECDEFAALQRGPMENLFFMPAGRAAGSAPELLSNGRLKLFLQRVEPLFDWIILDSSPVIPVSDATLVAGACDGILMVVKSDSTPSDLARRAREEFPDKLLLGVVLNGTSSGELGRSKYYYGEAVNSHA